MIGPLLVVIIALAIIYFVPIDARAKYWLYALCALFGLLWILRHFGLL